MDNLFFTLSNVSYGLGPVDTAISSTYTSFQMVQFILNIAFSPLVVFLFYLIFRYQQFHKNFNILMINVLAFYVVLTIAREVSLMEAYNCPHTDHCYLTELFVSKNVLFCEILKYAGMLGYLISTYSLIAERTWATIYLKGYEKKSSVGVMLMILGLQWMVAFGTAYFLIKARLPPTSIVSVAVVSTLLLTAVFVVMKRVNKKRYYLSKTVGSAYSLSERYQLSENVKTMPIITALLKISFIMNVLILGAISVMLFASDVSQKLLFKLIMDLLLTIYPPITSLLTLRYVEKWRAIVEKYCGRNKSAVSSSLSWAPRLPGALSAIRHQKTDADIYFQQLHKRWA